MKTLFSILTTLILMNSVLGFDVSKSPKPWVDIDSNYVITKVIDARKTNYLGYWNGFEIDSNIKIDQGSINQKVLSLLQKTKRSRKQTPLVIRINFLMFDFTTSKNESTGQMGMNLSFLQKKGDHYVELFQSAEHINWESFSDKLAPRKFSELLDQSIAQFNKRVKIGGLSSVKIDKEELLNVTFIVPETSFLWRGLYLDYYSYRDNKPDTQYHATYKRRYDGVAANDYAILTDINPKPARPFFGYHDGQKVFLQLGERFFPVDYANGFATIKYSEFTNADILKSSLLQSAFGLMGAIIYSDVLKNRSYYDAPAYLDANTFVLDPRIGMMVPSFKIMDLSFMRDLTPDQTPLKKVIVYVDNNSKRRQKVLIKNSETPDVELNRGQYYSFYIKQSDKLPMSFYLKSPFDVEHSFSFYRYDSAIKIFSVRITQKNELKLYEPPFTMYRSIFESLDMEYDELISE